MNFRHAFLLSFLFPLALGMAKEEPKAPVAKTETATFAGGCFWCMQPPFDKLKGVVSTTVGYTGGQKKDPTYKEVCSGTTGHTESIQVVFDPAQISFKKLLDTFWRSFDPTDAKGQFADRGNQYRPAIFYHSPAQKKQAEESKAQLAKSGPFKKPIAVEITKASIFYPAEKYHQKYYTKEPEHYKKYRKGSGRDGFLKRMWGDK